MPLPASRSDLRPTGRFPASRTVGEIPLRPMSARTVALRDGSQVLLRPVRADDKPRLAEGLARLTAVLLATNRRCSR
jgi:hypothetical protein